MRINTQAISILVHARSLVFLQLQAQVQNGERLPAASLPHDVLTHAIAYLQRGGLRVGEARLIAEELMVEALEK